MVLFKKHILRGDQFDRNDIFRLNKLTDHLCQFGKRDIPKALKGYEFHHIFEEASTRTLEGSKKGAKCLGARCEETLNPKFSSLIKGEMKEDNYMIYLGLNYDGIIVRSKEIGVASMLAGLADEYNEYQIANGNFEREKDEIVIYNAGDGPGQHPTQALIDLYAIWKRHGTYDLTYAFVGDLKSGRTVHSLADVLASNFGKVDAKTGVQRESYIKKMYFVSPESSQIPDDHLQLLQDNNVPFEKVTDLKEIAQEVDVWYWTRPQKERNSQEENKLLVEAKHLCLSVGLLMATKEREKTTGFPVTHLHPMPRNNEIPIEVADPRKLRQVDPQIAMYAQAFAGWKVRAALFAETQMMSSVVDYRLRLSPGVMKY